MNIPSIYKILDIDELFVLLKSDPAAEKEFYRRYKLTVKKILKSYHYRPAERDDLIQEGMIGLFHAIESFDPDKKIKFSTYSNVCIHNRIRNFLSSYKNHKRKFDSQIDIEDLASPEDRESETIKAEISDRLREEITRLPDLEKKVVNGYLSGKSYKLIASELEISSKKVDNILMKIKSRLSDHLKNKTAEEV